MAEEKVKKEEILYTHHLACSKCFFKFSVDSPHKSNNKIGVDKMGCPICKKPIMIDPASLNVSVKPSKKSQAHMNVEASKTAIEMAGNQKMADNLTEEMVPVTSYQEGRGKGRQTMIPKKVIDSIEKKVKESGDLEE